MSVHLPNIPRSGAEVPYSTFMTPQGQHENCASLTTVNLLQVLFPTISRAGQYTLGQH